MTILIHVSKLSKLSTGLKNGLKWKSLSSLLLPPQFLSEEEARQKQERQSLQESHENQLKAVQEQCDASTAELQQLQVHQQQFVYL